MDVMTATLGTGEATGTLGTEEMTTTRDLPLARRGAVAGATARGNREIVRRAVDEGVPVIKMPKEPGLRAARVALRNEQGHDLTIREARTTASRRAERIAEVPPEERQDGLPLRVT